MGTLFTLLNGESPDVYTIEPTLDPFEFEEQHNAVSAHFTSKQKLPFAIQEYSDP